MGRRRRSWLVALAALGLAGAACGGSGGSGSGSGSGTTLRVSGSTTVNPVAADAAEALRRDGMKITVDDQGGSAGGLAQLGQGQVEIAMSSKPVGDADRAAYPKVAFTPTEIGKDAVGIVVRREVVDGGLTNVTKDQLARLFEGRVANWKELGGPDLTVFVYDKEPGRGTREVLDKFLYGKDGKAPPPPQSDNYAVVGGNEETRAKVLSTPGSVAPLSVAFAEGNPKLAVLQVDGVAPTPSAVRDDLYPMARPLFLVTNGAPAGDAKRFVDYVLSAKGQALVKKHGYLTLADLGKT
ncbi:MAG TPA: phosphate ABC transporter substrate-binding protein [Acidimicrobiales bacterium]|nr:phosphate ABC transporter substrate-binding protein [Acidimicrobiales bacterium]